MIFDWNVGLNFERKTRLFNPKTRNFENAKCNPSHFCLVCPNHWSDWTARHQRSNMEMLGYKSGYQAVPAADSEVSNEHCNFAFSKPQLTSVAPDSPMMLKSPPIPSLRRILMPPPRAIGSNQRCWSLVPSPPSRWLASISLPLHLLCWMKAFLSLIHPRGIYCATLTRSSP